MHNLSEREFKSQPDKDVLLIVQKEVHRQAKQRFDLVTNFTRQFRNKFKERKIRHVRRKIARTVDPTESVHRKKDVCRELKENEKSISLKDKRFSKAIRKENSVKNIQKRLDGR